MLVGGRILFLKTGKPFFLTAATPFSHHNSFGHHYIHLLVDLTFCFCSMLLLLFSYSFFEFSVDSPTSRESNRLLLCIPLFNLPPVLPDNLPPHPPQLFFPYTSNEDKLMLLIYPSLMLCATFKALLIPMNNDYLKT